jgi:hypothetical protein
MSAFGGKADINQQSSERPLIAISGHSSLYEKLPIPTIQWMPMGMVAIKWVTRAMIALFNFDYAYAR